ncbi:flagellar basal-body rod protein FlgG [Lebetimonas natsushimae]|uniref:Flagellar basal-body rod protein FlgG n=1 Tax=Lebetimonas natsushimae TaxID=1936991 RepID=A0A292YEI0_9BACT|nr:flagellar basal-body rod protein FlgF [Lebetimonas natsushimae]GAX87958.1 flagellar basal-body rod protein FlgG [Lebetimonas natsushimae]
MINGYYSATGGMVTQFNRLNVISNNLANVNTAGYKQDDIIIGDYERIFSEKRDNLPLENNTKEAAKFVNRALNKVPIIVEEYTKFDIGNLQKTGNPLDLALKQKNAFFSIKTPDGEKLTRAGNFSLDSNGFLVTKDGFQVLDDKNKPIVLNPSYPVTINQNGNIYQNNTLIATLKIIKIDNLNTLKKIGNSLFDFVPGSEIIDSKNSVLQGFLEKSNVNPIEEMTNLIETNRLVEAYQKVMTTFMDDLNRNAIEKLANIRG